MIDNIFPIHTSKSCPLKWSWNTLFLWEGVVASCHRTGRIPLPDDFNNIHNNNIRLTERRLMSNNQWPTNSCNYCKQLEDLGGVSDRIRQIEKLKDDNDPRLIPKELFTSPTSIELTPTMLEVYFSNVCNMSCLYCNSKLSSKWAEENKRYGEHDSSIDLLESAYKERLEKFWKWFKDIYKDLRVFNILGGEPFFQKEFDQCIEFFEANEPNPNLQFTIFSNLKISKTKLKSHLNRLLNLKNNNRVASIKIICSLDNWGKEQEYVRYGMNLLQWEENFKLILNEYPDIKITIASTISSLSIKTMHPLMENLSEYNKVRHVPIGFNVVKSPTLLDPGHFPNGFFDNDFERIISSMPSYTDYDKSQINYMKSIQQNINEMPHNPVIIDQLKTYLEKMDSRRNTNWREVFPWLI